MKKCLVIVVLLSLISTVVSAQDGLGLEVGYVSSTNITKGNDSRTNTPVLNGFKVGVNYGLNITKGFLFQPGVYYSYLSDKRDMDFVKNDQFYIVDLMKEQFLNIPLHLMYNFRISDNVTGLYIFAGPTFIIGISSTSEVGVVSKNAKKSLGQAKYDYYSQDISFENIANGADLIIKDYLPQGGYKKFDISMGVGIGIEVLDHINLKLGYDWGLMNRLQGDAAANFTTHRNQFYIAAGIQF